MNHSTDLVECWLILTILCMVEMFTWTMKRTGWCSLHSGLEELTSDLSLLMRLVTLWVCLTPGDCHCYDCKGRMSCGGVVIQMINHCFFVICEVTLVLWCSPQLMITKFTMWSWARETCKPFNNCMVPEQENNQVITSPRSCFLLYLDYNHNKN